MKAEAPSMTIAIVFICGSLFAGEGIRFIDHIGEFPLEGTNEKIVVKEDLHAIQFRIRGLGPAHPAIQKGNDWFIAVVDNNHIWVHLGAGRLFYYSWPSKNCSKVDEWTYPHIGKAVLPEIVQKRLTNIGKQVRGTNAPACAVHDRQG